jgi:gas vesicle protein
MAEASSAALIAAANDATPPSTLEVRLAVTDPEVVAELARHVEGEARDRFAMSALRIGVLALRTATGQIDAGAIRHAGQALVGDVRELLSERATVLTKDLASSLAQYLDPKSGELARRVQALVQKDGEMDRLLGAHLGPEDSVLARSLAAHLGEGSAIFKMLSPSDANGLRAQLTKTLEDALGEQKKHILREFSLDHPESALSRLVLRVEATEKKIGDQFSTDDDTSALSRLSKMLQATSDQVGKNLTLDDENSALSRLKRELLATIEDLAKKNVELQLQVRETLGRLEKGKDDAARTTLKGGIFEDALGELLRAEAQRAGDVFEATGNTVGAIKNNKVGDFVIELGTDSVAAHARVAWEAKEDQKYDMKRALDEVDEARRNRQAQVGVFVFSSKTAPEAFERFARHGNDIVVVWDADDASSDVLIRAAYSLARALCVRERKGADESRAAIDEIDRATRAVEKQIGYLEEIRKWAETVKSSGEKIGDRAQKMSADLAREVERLDQHIAALKTKGAG